jgi:hypothetical protein
LVSTYEMGEVKTQYFIGFDILDSACIYLFTPFVQVLNYSQRLSNWQMVNGLFLCKQLEVKYIAPPRMDYKDIIAVSSQGGRLCL